MLKKCKNKNIGILLKGRLIRMAITMLMTPSHKDSTTMRFQLEIR